MIASPSSKIHWPQWPVVDHTTIRAVQDVLTSGRWAISGHHLGRESCEETFARRYAAYNNVAHCVTLDHGTSALIAGLEALDVGFGDEVIVPGFTWVAPAIAVLSVNAVPVIVDVEADTFCLDPVKVAAAITPRTKAIIPIHLYGCMADMDQILALASSHRIAVLEDAAHSHGSEWRGRKAGTLGDIGAFSFQQGKVLTCGEGGAAITNHPTYAKRIENSAWNARRRLDWRTTPVGAMQLVEGEKRFGTNRCLSEIQAGLLVDQLDRLDAQNRQREAAARWLDEQLIEMPGVLIMRRRPEVTRQTYYGYVIRIDPQVFGSTAAEVIAGLQAALDMTECLVHAPYKPLHRNPLYAHHPARHALPGGYLQIIDSSSLCLPGCDRAYEQGIVFHHSVLLADQSLLARVVATIEAIRKKTVQGRTCPRERIQPENQVRAHGQVSEAANCL
ncbi:MAG: DegT/DnrJ/EryC1/StrS family aminotransferase [Verrucomicrobia bacterium]|nr:DegT/DnrJ/EryC1/StrS family aminotransferase [Verrucomicrobiota bacterium]